MRRFGVWIGGLAIVYALLGVVFYWGGYDTVECRRLKGIVGDAQLQDELIRWVDHDLESALTKWLKSGLIFSKTPVGRPGNSYISEPDFDFAVLGFPTEGPSVQSPQIRLVTWNHLTPHNPKSYVMPDQGLKFLISVTRSVSFLQVSRVAILVRMLDAPDFGVDSEHIVKLEGRLAVYCEPRD